MKIVKLKSVTTPFKGASSDIIKEQIETQLSQPSSDTRDLRDSNLYGNSPKILIQ